MLHLLSPKDRNRFPLFPLIDFKLPFVQALLKRGESPISGVDLLEISIKRPNNYTPKANLLSEKHTRGRSSPPACLGLQFQTKWLTELESSAVTVLSGLVGIN